MSDLRALSDEDVHELANEDLTDEADEKTNVVFRLVNEVATCFDDGVSWSE